MQENNKSLKRKTMTGVFWQFAQRMLGQVISFGVSVVLARILLPSDYGTVALAGMYTVILSIFVNCGLGAALIQKKKIDDLDLCSIFWAQFVFASVVYALIFLSAPLFSSIFNDSKLTAILRVSALTMPLGALGTIQGSIVNRRMEFKTYFYRTLVSSVLSGIIGLTMAFNGYGAWSLVGQNMSGTIIGTITVYSQVKWLPRFKFSKERFKTLFSYGWKYTLTNLITTFCYQLKGYLIGFQYTKADLAFYNRGEGLPGIISRNITGSITSAIFPALTKLQDDKLAVRRGISRSMKTSSYIVMPMFLGLAAISDKLVVLLYTEKWHASIPFMQIICIMDCFSLLASANFQALNAIGRTDVTLKLELYKKPVMIALLFVAVFISPFAICVGMLIYTIWSLVINAFPNRKLIHYPLKEQLKDISINALLAASMAGIVYVLGHLSPFNNFVTIIIQLFIGTIFYLSVSHLTKNESYLFIKDMIVEYIHTKKDTLM